MCWFWCPLPTVIHHHESAEGTGSKHQVYNTIPPTVASAPLRQQRTRSWLKSKQPERNTCDSFTVRANKSYDCTLSRTSNGDHSLRKHQHQQAREGKAIRWPTFLQKEEFLSIKKFTVLLYANHWLLPNIFLFLFIIYLYLFIFLSVWTSFLLNSRPHSILKWNVPFRIQASFGMKVEVWSRTLHLASEWFSIPWMVFAVFHIWSC